MCGLSVWCSDVDNCSNQSCVTSFFVLQSFYLAGNILSGKLGHGVQMEVYASTTSVELFCLIMNFFINC